MTYVSFHQFIRDNRDELIRRCQASVDARSTPPVTRAEIENGVPLFLDQLVIELRHGPSQTRAIATGAGQHGRDLLQQGFSLQQVVHDYGDLCQSATDLALEMHAPISIEEFRTLNRCLDDAIAGAVAEHASGRETSDIGRSAELRRLTETALAAFAALEAGTVGIKGSTGALIRASLMNIRALLDRADAENDAQ